MQINYKLIWMVDAKIYFGILLVKFSVVESSMVVFKADIFSICSKTRNGSTRRKFISHWSFKLVDQLQAILRGGFHRLKATFACYEHSKLYLILLEAKGIKLSAEIIIETIGFVEILGTSYLIPNKPV